MFMQSNEEKKTASLVYPFSLMFQYNTSRYKGNDDNSPTEYLINCIIIVIMFR